MAESLADLVAERDRLAARLADANAVRDRLLGRWYRLAEEPDAAPADLAAELDRAHDAADAARAAHNAADEAVTAAWLARRSAP